VWRSGISAGGRGRAFDVYCNGRVLASRLDIFEQAGGDNRALVLTYRGLKPNAQGKLELSFVPVVDYAILCALEVEDEAL
jgi:hypothetical protein